MRVNGHRFFIAGSAGATISNQRFWQIAVWTAAVVGSSQASRPLAIGHAQAQVALHRLLADTHAAGNLSLWQFVDLVQDEDLLAAAGHAFDGGAQSLQCLLSLRLLLRPGARAAGMRTRA